MPKPKKAGEKKNSVGARSRQGPNKLSRDTVKSQGLDAQVSFGSSPSASPEERNRVLGRNNLEVIQEKLPGHKTNNSEQVKFENLRFSPEQKDDGKGKGFTEPPVESRVEAIYKIRIFAPANDRPSRRCLRICKHEQDPSWL